MNMLLNYHISAKLNVFTALCVKQTPMCVAVPVQYSSVTV